MGRLRERRRGVNRGVRRVNRGVGRYRPAATRSATFVLIESGIDGCASARRRAAADTTLLMLLDFGNGLVARADGGIASACCRIAGTNLTARSRGCTAWGTAARSGGRIARSGGFGARE